MFSRRERRKQETRAALLRAAMHLCRERGIYGTRVADITERADVGKGVFYNYFDTKEALIAELVRQAMDLLDHELTSKLADEPTIERRIDQLARLHESFFESRPDFALLIHQARGLLQLGGESSAPLRGVFRDYLALITRWLPAPPANGSWSQDLLLDIAAAIAGTVSGYRSFRLAAGLPVNTVTPGQLLTGGVPRLVQERTSP
jgi:AcrR family transcriptional regulator